MGNQADADQPAPRRHFYYWCPNCQSTLHLETAERTEDPYRGVAVMPDEAICPMCTVPMRDWDYIAATDERFQNQGTWEDFELWNTEQARGNQTGHGTQLDTAEGVPVDSDHEPPGLPIIGHKRPVAEQELRREAFIGEQTRLGISRFFEALAENDDEARAHLQIALTAEQCAEVARVLREPVSLFECSPGDGEPR